MTGLADQSIAWVNNLKDFVNNQSMLIAPTSKQDLTRMNQLSKMNAMAKTVQDNAINHLIKAELEDYSNNPNNPNNPNKELN